MAIPVQKGQQLKVFVHDLGHKGEGIAKFEGFTLFIEGVFPEDELEVIVTEVTPRFAHASPLQIISKSKHRKTQSDCEYSQNCGGCQLIDLNQSFQNQWKIERLKTLLTKLAKVDSTVVKPLTLSPAVLGYRNKAQFPVRFENNEYKIGFFSLNSHQLVSIKKCAIQDAGINQILVKFKAFLEETRWMAYNEKTGLGLVKHLIVRTNSRSEILLGLALTETLSGTQKKLLIKSFETFPGLKGIFISVNSKQSNTILQAPSTCIWGDSTFIQTLNGMQFKGSLDTFFQINTQQAENLFQIVLSSLSFKASDTVWDLFCGVGVIALQVAPKVKAVFGVEMNLESIQLANQNKILNSCDNAQFLCADLSDRTETLSALDLPDIVIVDPPRKGCSEALLERIVSVKPREIAYVSCDPATLSRDIRFLTQKGYTLKLVVPVDMFPQTVHLECIAIFTYK